jgi:Putative transposase
MCWSSASAWRSLIWEPALPAEQRELVRRHQCAVDSALFEASRQALRTPAADPRFVGTDRIGFFGVLHTWGRTLEYHPHVHYVVTGGGISADGARWLPSRADFFEPVKALSILFRAKFRDGLARDGPLDQADTAVRTRDWVVHSQATGDGRACLRYLAPYVFRAAIGDNRIVSCDDGKVTFTYRSVGSNRPRKMTLDAHEFLRRLLQHVLPTGFQKVRHYGFQSPDSRTLLEAVRWLITVAVGAIFTLQTEPPQQAATIPVLRCPACGGPLSLVGFAPAPIPAVFDTS